jgi:cytochrome c oxidase cbb3-type subunit 1
LAATVVEKRSDQAQSQPEDTPVAELSRLRKSSAADLASQAYFVLAGLFFGAWAVSALLWSASVAFPGVVELATANASQAPHGNLLPVVRGLLVFGWLSSAAFGSILYIVPRLTGSPLPFGRLLVLNALGWAGLVGLGSLAVASGFGRPFWIVSYPSPILVVMAASAALVLVAVVLSVLSRTTPRIYPALWYFVAALVWLIAALILASLPIYAGVGQAMQQVFAGHTILGLWLLVAAIGTAYFVVPKELGAPLYSRRLALLGLWGLGLFWMLASGSRLVFSPADPSYQSVGIAFAIASSVPLAATFANLGRSLKGLWAQVGLSAIARWVVAGLGALGVYCVLMPFYALRSVNQIAGLTGSVFGVDDLALLGIVGCWTFAAAFYALPRLSGRQFVWSRAQDIQLGLFVTGTLVAVTAQVVGGAVQGFVVATNADRAVPVSFGDGWQAVAGPQRWFAAMATLGMGLVGAAALVAIASGVRTLIGGYPGAVETVVIPEELAQRRLGEEVLPEETRRRLIEPLMLPVGSAVALVAVVWAVSRILLAVQQFGSKALATGIALAFAALILGGAAALAVLPRLSGSAVAAIVALGLAAVLAGGTVADFRLRASSAAEHEEGAAQAAEAVAIDLVAKNIAFDKSSISVPANKPVKLSFKNEDQVQHNFALYADEGMRSPIFQGDLAGPGTVTYSFTSPSSPGTYYFFCDVHPNMKGTFVVQS